VMESLALRRPVLVADTSGLRELAEQGLVRAIPLNSSPEDIALAVQQQIEAPIVSSERLNLASWDDCVNQLEAVYQRSIAREACAS
jgi:glycosyltransferase involved in cell wall biosynthesis